MKRNRKIFILITIIATINIIIIILFKTIYKFNLHNILDTYDLNINEITAIYELEKENNFYIILTLIFINILLLIFILFKYFEERKKRKQFEKIRLNLIEIDKGNYYSFIKDIEEREFGTFQNDIYSTVIRLREYAEKINEDKNKLSSYMSDISHQLRTPLLAVNVLTDNLIQTEETNNKNYKTVLKISRELDKMQWLVDNLLKMAQLDIKVIKFRKEKIYVCQLIQEVMKNVEILADLYEIKIIANGEKNAKFIGDIKWNIEALTNIVKNAIEHSKKDDSIYINYTENLLYTEIAIKDERKRNFTRRFTTYI